MDQVWSSILALAEDRTMGASETTERAARALAGIARQDLPDAIETLIRAHPSMAPLWRLGSVVLSDRNHAAAAERFAADLADDRMAAAVLAPVLPSTLLTISSSATVKETVALRKPWKVLCMASHPGGEGLQMVGALAAYTEATMISDEEAIDQVPADAVVVGADAVTPTSVVNKVKTRALVESAQRKSVPCYAVAGGAKFVPAELPPAELFEATPLEGFATIATPGGLLLPAEASARAARVQLHPALMMLIERL